MTRSPHVLLALLTCSVACGGGTEDTGNAAPVAAPAAPDTAAARVLRDSAQATLATLLERPATAVFDSVIVVQPPPGEDGRPGVLTVCGRFGGPSRSSARFVYQSKWTVFVEEEANRQRFGELWERGCAAEGSVIVVGGDPT